MPELVALDLPGGAGFVDALRAVWDTGDAAAPLDPRLPAPARDALLRALRPTKVVGSDGEFHTVRDGTPVEEGDALVLATSGSSGGSKGVVLTHDALQASSLATSTRLAIDPDRHAWLACLPLAHVGGLSVVFRALITDTPVTVLPEFDREVVEALGRTGRATHVSLVTTALQRIDPSVFTCILLGGARPPRQCPPNAVATYGLTETASGIVYDGVPLDGVEVAVGDGDGGDDGSSGGGGGAGESGGGTVGAAGEILVRAPMLFRCYRDGRSARVRGPDGRADWFATGDIGHVDDDGLLRVSGRREDVIVTGGEKVWPDAVERALAAHPHIEDVAVWKRSDPEWGERVVAWIVPNGDPPPTLEEVRDLVGSTLSPWAAPKEIVMTTSLPRTLLGKVRRRDLT